MLAQWTGEVIGKMHIYGVSSLELAEELGWNAKYLSTVLNCKRSPKNAKETVSAALDAIIARTDAS